MINLGLQSANRDPDIFENADVFDITREQKKAHMTFGQGARYCLGAHLATLEIQETIDYLYTRFPNMQRVEDGTDIQYTPLLRTKMTRFEVLLEP